MKHHRVWFSVGAVLSYVGVLSYVVYGKILEEE